MKKKGRRERRKKQKKGKEKEKRLACETGSAETMVAVYSVLTCGIVAARL
jgi:hypothetical protein